MRYPNVHNALNRILRSEVLFLFSIAIGAYYGLLGSWGPLSGTIWSTILSWMLRACCIAVAILRITALGQAALDEDSFRSAQRLSLIYLLVCVLNTVLMTFITDTLDMLQATGVLQQEVAFYCSMYLLLFMIEIAASFSTVLDFLGSLARIALCQKLVQENDQIQHFKLVYGRLLLGSFALLGLKFLIPDGMIPSSFFGALFGLALLATTIVAWWLFLRFLRSMSEALLGIKWKEENQWNGVARELRPNVLDLYDPDAAVHAPPEEPRLSWKPEAPWKGVAKELLPESARPAAAEAPLPDFAPKPKPPRSIWELDVERFFKDRDIKFTKEDEATKDLRFPNAYRGVQFLIRAEQICLISLLLTLLFFTALSLGLLGTDFSDPLQALLLLTFVLSILGRVACLPLWRAMLRVPLDEQAFFSTKKLLIRSFYLILIVFITPFYIGIFFGEGDFSFIKISIVAVWIIWCFVPFPVILSATIGLLRLAEKLGEWDQTERWLKLRRRLVLTSVLLPTAFMIVAFISLLSGDPYLSGILPILIVGLAFLGLIAVWLTLMQETTLAMQTLGKAKLVQSSAELGAGIDYHKEAKPETEAAN